MSISVYTHRYLCVYVYKVLHAYVNNPLFEFILKAIHTHNPSHTYTCLDNLLTDAILFPDVQL